MREPDRSADKALTHPAFRRLYLGALQINDKSKRIETCFIILMAGRVGLRAGEIQHMRREWIDWYRGEIAIPRYDPCGCTNCWANAKAKDKNRYQNLRDDAFQVIEESEEFDSDDDMEKAGIIRNVVENSAPEDVLAQLRDAVLSNRDSRKEEEDNEEADATLLAVCERHERLEDEERNGQKANNNKTAEEILYEERWQPKYSRSARRVPFGHSLRLCAAVDTFFIENEFVDMSQGTMRRRVRDAAKNAEGVNPDYVSLRGLRATAATHVSTFLRHPKTLQDFMGWTSIDTARRYLRRSGRFTTEEVHETLRSSQIGSIHRSHSHQFRPPLFPEEPLHNDNAELLKYFPGASRYPILANPLKFKKEPFDPMKYHQERNTIAKIYTNEDVGDVNRQDAIKTAQRFSPEKVRVPHPRSRNPTGEIEYDYRKHKIKDHDDGSLAIVDPSKEPIYEGTRTLEELGHLPTQMSFEHHEKSEFVFEEDRSFREFQTLEEWEEEALSSYGPIGALIEFIMSIVDKTGNFISEIMPHSVRNSLNALPKPQISVVGLISLGVISFILMDVLGVLSISVERPGLLAVFFGFLLYVTITQAPEM